MTVEIYAEQEGMRLVLVISTVNLESHSALQEVPKESIEIIKRDMRDCLQDLIELAVRHRKVT